MTYGLSKRAEILALVGIFVIYSGALSPISLALQVNPRLGGVVRGGFALIGLPLLIAGFCLNRRWEFAPMALFGLLPYIYLLYGAFTRNHLEGSYIYLYQFAPYLCAGLIWGILVTGYDRVLFWTVLGLGTCISLRALFVFLYPDLAPHYDPISESADGFIVYEFIGAFPRVFYPGQAMVFLGLALCVRGVIRASGRDRMICAAFLCIGSLGLLVSMTRGLILIGAVLLVVEVLWTLNDARVALNRKLNVLVVGLSVGATVLGVVLASGYGDRLLRGMADVASSDRMSLNDRNLIWREKQADAAFSMMKSDRDWVVGMGTTASVPMGHGTNNELHLGYHSVLWTFGLVGLTILIIILTSALAGGIWGPRARPYWREMWIVLLFLAAIGTYTPVFTMADYAVVLVLAATYVWLPCPVRSEAETGVGPAGATWRPRPQAGLAHTPPRRRWSQMVGETHGPR